MQLKGIKVYAEQDLEISNSFSEKGHQYIKFNIEKFKLLNPLKWLMFF